MSQNESSTVPTREELEDLHAADGVGHLLERDYRLEVRGSTRTPEQVVELLRTDFPSFSPQSLASFQRVGSRLKPLELDDVLSVDIMGIGRSHVTIIHTDQCSITMRTQMGHPEAGRITFGAQPSADGSVVLEIKSRARAGGHRALLMYLMGGKDAQTQIWTTFLERLAAECGGQPMLPVQISERKTQDTISDTESVDAPTFGPAEV